MAPMNNSEQNNECRLSDDYVNGYPRKRKEEEDMIELERWNPFMDALAQGENNELALVWMQVILMDQLYKVYNAEEAKNGTIEMPEKADGDKHIPVKPDGIITQNEASDNPRPKPYASGDTADQNRQNVLLTKDKCPDIVPAEDEFVSPEPKRYPVSGFKVGPNEDTTEYKGCPDFQKEFEQYNAGELKLKFLYIFWGSHLGTSFNKLVFDITRYYMAYGKRKFQIAIIGMVDSLNLPIDTFSAEDLESDTNTLDEWAAMF